MHAEDMLFFFSFFFSALWLIEKRYSSFDDGACRGAPHLPGLMKADGQKGRSRVGRRALNKFLRKFVSFSRVDSFSALERSYEISKHLKQEPYKHNTRLF